MLKKKLPYCLLILATSVPLTALNGFAQATQSTQEQIAKHARAAQQHLSERRPDLAIPELKSVIALDPANIDAQANLGVLLFFQNDYAGATPHLRIAFDAQPTLTRIEALLGIAEKRTGDNAGARTHLEASFAAITDTKLKLQIGMELVELYTASQSLEQATAVVNAMRQADPVNPAVLYVAYRVYSDLAGEAMLSLALAAPESPQMHQVMAHEESRRGEVAGARAQYQKALAADPKLPGIHFEIAELLGASDDATTKQGAEAEYKAAIIENPLDERAHERLGDLASRRGDFDQALADYNTALHLNPDDAEAKFGLAKILIARKEPSKALPILESAVQLEPTNAAAHFRLSTLYRELGRTADSQREVEEYKHYKELKEKLAALFKEMQLRPAVTPGNQQEDK